MENYRNKFKPGDRVVIKGDLGISFWIVDYDVVTECYLVRTEDDSLFRPMKLDKSIMEIHCEPYTSLIKALNSANK